MTEHRPGLHCHHDVPATECTLCTYLAMEELHQTLLDRYLESQWDETTPQVDEEGRSPGLADPQNQE